MRAFKPGAPSVSDYEAIRRNGQWYVQDQSGYGDILRRGVPRPTDPRTVLAELHSPHTPDFLFGNIVAGLPFLVSDRARTVFDRHAFGGFEWAEVLVAKIATKGVRANREHTGEPGNAISKSRGVSGVAGPQLHAVYVTGFVDILLHEVPPDHSHFAFRPFEILSPDPLPDLFRLRHEGEPYSRGTCCSVRFRDACMAESFTNIEFDPVG